MHAVLVDFVNQSVRNTALRHLAILCTKVKVPLFLEWTRYKRMLLNIAMTEERILLSSERQDVEYMCEKLQITAFERYSGQVERMSRSVAQRRAKSALCHWSEIESQKIGYISRLDSTACSHKRHGSWTPRANLPSTGTAAGRLGESLGTCKTFHAVVRRRRRSDKVLTEATGLINQCEPRETPIGVSFRLIWPFWPDPSRSYAAQKLDLAGLELFFGVFQCM